MQGRDRGHVHVEQFRRQIVHHLAISLNGFWGQILLCVLLHELGQKHRQSRRHRRSNTGGAGLSQLVFLLLLSSHHSRYTTPSDPFILKHNGSAADRGTRIWNSALAAKRKSRPARRSGGVDLQWERLLSWLLVRGEAVCGA
jgi:hypothetical protein